MRYKGSFKDINDKEYLVDIVTNDDMTTETEIILGTPPFTVSYESGDNTIYKPIKYSSATCTIITESYYKDIYTGANLGTRISLIDNSTKLSKFIGYITPNVYNLQYDGVALPLELECVDGLSTLKNIKYSTIGSEKNIVSFADIVLHILLQANAYSRLYVSNAIQKNNEASINILEELYISENNFFDEDNEPMKCSEVLEEIAKYLNVTIYANGVDVYMIDYDAIVSDEYVEEYTCIILGNRTILTTTQVETKTITAESFRGSSGDFSVDNVYNKASVTAEHYTVNNVIEEIFEDEELSTYVEKSRLSYTGAKRNDPIDPEMEYGVNHFSEAFPMWYKFHKHPQITSHYYFANANNDGKIEKAYGDLQLTDYDALKSFIGATLYSYALSEVSLGEREWEDYYYHPIESTKNYTNCILLHLNNSYTKKEYDNGIYRKLLTFQPSTTNLIANDNTYILLNMNSIWRDTQRYYTGDKYKGDFVVETDGGFQYLNIMPSIPFNIFNQNYKAVLRYDTKRDTAHWELTQENVLDVENVTKPTMLPFWVNYKIDSLEEGYKKDNILDSSLPLYNNISYDMGFEEDTEGIAIKIPAGTNVADLRIVLYQPYMPAYDDYEGGALLCVMLDNVNFEIIHKNKDASNKNKKEEENTTYENVIDGNWVEELGEITFKVCTFDNKEMNYSAVYLLNGDKLTYADTLTNKALNQTLRQEEMLIYRIVQLYKNPRIKLNLTLNNDFQLNNRVIYPTQEADKKFIVDALEIDFENDTTLINLIEKV